MPPPSSGMLSSWMWAPIPELEIAPWAKEACQPPALPLTGPQCSFSAVSMGAKNGTKECLTVFSESLSLSPHPLPLFSFFFGHIIPHLPHSVQSLLLGNKIRFQKKALCFLFFFFFCQIVHILCRRLICLFCIITFCTDFLQPSNHVCSSVLI